MSGVHWANYCANIGSVDSFFTCGEYGFSLNGVGRLILGNGYGI